jgi:glycosyltransferase involved in cell wall biosynthesis
MQEIELIAIMPVYNEEGTIRSVVQEWHDELCSLKMDFELHVYNDGSKDASLAILRELQKSLQHLVVHDQPNRGHGPTILHCYRNASNVQWLFQVDSDNEVRPESFRLLWDKKDKYDFLLGRRTNKQNPLARQVISAVASGMVRFAFGRGVSDVNSPFRLMRVAAFRDVFHFIPDQTFAPNVIVTGIACLRKMRIVEIEIPYQFRQTGTVSINKMRLLRAAWRSGVETISFIWSYRKNKKDTIL